MLSKNYKLLKEKLSPLAQGLIFVHIFVSRVHPGHYIEFKLDWMTKYFFEGGTNASEDTAILSGANGFEKQMECLLSIIH